MKKTIKIGIEYLPVRCSEYQWLQLDKNYFALDKDIYLCFAYIPPQYSSFYVD